MDDITARLPQVDACAVSDALDKLGLPSAVSGLDPALPTSASRAEVVTVPAREGRRRPLAPAPAHAIEAAQPGDVIVIEQRTGIDAAMGEEPVARGAAPRVSGVIIEGPGRDIDGLAIRLPGVRTHPYRRTARGRIVETGTNVPITVGEVTVSLTYRRRRQRWPSCPLRGSAACWRPPRRSPRGTGDGRRARGDAHPAVMGKSYETMLKS